MSSLNRRLKQLEESTHPAVGGFPPEWPFEDQVEDILEALLIHSCTQTRQLVTDREINVLGLMHAYWNLPSGVGEYILPSGAVATWADNGDGTVSAGLSRNVSIEDLPDEVRRRAQRMEPKEQQDQERRLLEGRGRDRLFLKEYRGLAVSWVRGEGGS